MTRVEVELFPPATILTRSQQAEAATLAELPLSILDLTPEQADTSALWGIRTLGSRFLRHPNHNAHHPNHKR